MGTPLDRRLLQEIYSAETQYSAVLGTFNTESVEEENVFEFPSSSELRQSLTNAGYSKKSVNAEIKALSGLSGYGNRR